MTNELQAGLQRVLAVICANKLAKRLIGPSGKALSRQAIYRWDKVPLHHVQRIAELTGIPEHEIRPDHYRDPSASDDGEVAA